MDVLNSSSNGHGETVLRENHTRGPRAAACGTMDRIPEAWKFSPKRVKEMFELYGY